MVQKIIRVGDSAAVIIPKKSLKNLSVKIGDKVDTKDKNGMFVIRPQRSMSKRDLKIAKLTLKFINRYRKDLEALAKK